MSPFFQIVVVIVLATLFIIAFLVNYLKKYRIIVAQDEAAIIFGRKSRFTNLETGETAIVGSRVIAKGNGAFKVPFFEDVIFIDLKSFTIPVNAERTLSIDGIRMNVGAIAIVKIADDEASIRKAGTQFGNLKKPENKKNLTTAMEETLQGHFRAIISTLTAKELNFEREKFIQQVQKAAGVPLEAMGIEIISFTMRHIADEEGYLDLLKKGTIAATEREQEEKVKAERLMELEAKRIREIQEESTREAIETKRIDVNRQLEINRIQAEQEKTIADEKRVQLTSGAEKEKIEEQILLREKERDLKQIENQKEVLQYELEAKKQVMQAEAQGEAQRLLLAGEAEGKRKLAEMYDNATEWTRLILILDELPALMEKTLGKDGLASIFKEIAQPMGNIKNVQIYDFGGNNHSSDDSPLTRFTDTAPIIFKKFMTQFQDLGLHIDVSKLLKSTTVKQDHQEELPPVVEK